MEERTGLEPASSAWEADVLPFTPTLHLAIPALDEGTVFVFLGDEGTG